ncbi:hypothetical protein NL676_005305 [Syzygium grande]|nr:hypothetical protein NL676_005305 [Syzygium grande]
MLSALQSSLIVKRSRHYRTLHLVLDHFIANCINEKRRPEYAVKKLEAQAQNGCLNLEIWRRFEILAVDIQGLCSCKFIAFAFIVFIGQRDTSDEYTAAGG